MNYILLAILVILNIFDVHYTKIALESGIKEANPIVNQIIQDWSFIGLMIVKGSFLGLLAVLLYFCRSRWVTISMILVCNVYGLVLFSHLMYSGG